MSVFNILLNLSQTARVTAQMWEGTLWWWAAGLFCLRIWITGDFHFLALSILSVQESLQGFLNYTVNFNLCFLPISSPKFNIFLQNSYQNTVASKNETFTCVNKTNNTYTRGQKCTLLVKNHLVSTVVWITAPLTHATATPPPPLLNLTLFSVGENSEIKYPNKVFMNKHGIRI